MKEARSFSHQTDIDECALYGYTGKPSYTSACINGVDQRTITCLAGYETSVTTHATSVKLTGSQPFTGCHGRTL